ncbi:carboxymuconolactone decarboxylase family protein [Granulicoccus sp. GXG6511]|uniref:carboxymuconolactone decarboxylase family protein n=1 Tax=Granulicoccus sp. GXG6511 TaxID=3381351 RepID=UPI003D7F11C0
MSRLFIDQQQPRIMRAHNSWAAAITASADAVGLDRKLVELVNLRVSQLNGCGICLDTHHRKAIEAGETERRIAVLPAWRHVDLYSEEERAALGLAEAITHLPDTETQDAAYAMAAAVFNDDQLAVVSWVAVAINSFNRVSITSHHPVRPRKEQA